MHVSFCYYYEIRILISKTLTGTYEGNIKIVKTLKTQRQKTAYFLNVFNVLNVSFTCAGYSFSNKYPDCIIRT
jgi:hypothetical protein